MEENKNYEVVNQETGEIEEVEKPRRVENLRVAKVLLLGGILFEGDRKKKKDPGMVVAFVDAVETDPSTGQPKLRGFNPVISCYVKNPSAEIIALLKEPVFTEKFIRISGNEDFTQFHGVLTEQEIAMYRQIMGDLANR